MDPDIKEKIDALLAELRSWDVEEDRHSIQELAEKFDLTVFVVRRISNAEGFSLRDEDGASDPEAPTKPLAADSQVTTRPEMLTDEVKENSD